MIAVDTNILVYAHRRDSRWHHAAADVVTRLGNGRGAWAIPWPCLHEFHAIVTHPRIFRPASTVEQAVEHVSAWRESPSLMCLAEDEAYWDVLCALVRRNRIVGPAVHDARIAALCLRHGVGELLTADRDFSRFPELVTRNPLSSIP